MTQPRLLGGRYELDGVVGRGGMAEVYRARDIRLDRVVAVKTLREDLARDATFQARFRREAQSAASLNHPSIIAVYDTGEDEAGPTNVPYIVMEYVDGRTLRDLLRDDRRLLPERALEITDGVLRALDYSHKHGIIHRDIKPANVMLTRSSEVKVMDFGIARAVSDAQATMTQTAQVIGTAQYLSPEQARGERVDARSDLYSTGCLLYELLTGRPPFMGDSPVAIAYQHVRENPIPPSRIDPDIPPWADSIVLKAMAKDPGERYQSAGDMRTDIQRALAGVPVAAPRPGMYPEGTQRMGGPAQGRTAAITGYGYGPEDGYDGGQGGGSLWQRRKWLWISAIVVAVLLIAGIAYAFAGGGKTAAVPYVAGDTQATAGKAIANAGLTFTVVQQASDTVAKGRAIGTQPGFGIKVPAGSQVKLIMSAGKKKVAVPDVKGKTSQEATVLLRNAGFQPDVVDAPNSTAPQGTVVGENPPAGTLLAPGATVTIRVSQGGSKIPSVIGQSLQQAESTLQSAGFNNLNVVYQPSSTVPDGNVISQSPTAGSSAPSSTQITLTVSQNTPTPSPTPSPTATTPTPTPTNPTTPPTAPTVP